jgi:hypothetical protein
MQGETGIGQEQAETHRIDIKCISYWGLIIDDEKRWVWGRNQKK